MERKFSCERPTMSGTIRVAGEAQEHLSFDAQFVTERTALLQIALQRQFEVFPVGEFSEPPFAV